MHNELLEESDANPCPWCGEKASLYVSGSYVDGWFAFVECTEVLKCGVRGPGRRTKGMSNDEYELCDQVIKMWNTVTLGE